MSINFILPFAEIIGMTATGVATAASLRELFRSNRKQTFKGLVESNSVRVYFSTKISKINLAEMSIDEAIDIEYDLKKIIRENNIEDGGFLQKLDTESLDEKRGLLAYIAKIIEVPV